MNINQLEFDCICKLNSPGNDGGRSGSFVGGDEG